MKKYGIYLAYPPMIDLRDQGLGRYLAEFLKGAEDRGDVQFVIACPSWMKKRLIELFDASGVGRDCFEIITPTGTPLLLRLHEAYVAFKNRPKRRNPLAVFFDGWVELSSRMTTYVESTLAGTRSIALVVMIGLVTFPVMFLVPFIKVIRKVVRMMRALADKVVERTVRLFSINELFERVSALAIQPKQDLFATRLYRLMEESEVCLMRRLIEARSDIVVWYSPTAFWPRVNELLVPRLMCVPDVMLANFPVGFAPVGGQRFLDHFRNVEKSIEGGQHFVTYSQDVKWRTLVQHYHVDPEAVEVVTHGANRLDGLIAVTGFPDNEAATKALCRNLFRSALLKAVNGRDAGNLGSKDIRYVFYASQFRPNKNVITLLRAYEHLLRRRYVGCKLVLTGSPCELPEVGRFIAEHDLANDVLCLHGLSTHELAACYHLADLAVNPSLSEGGCPFTFTEALSVGTPVVMARIPVTEEVITDPNLKNMMLFDPYDWRNVADRIEWGLHNRATLLEHQKPFFEKLSKRTWREVVDEYIEILDRISAKETTPS